MKVAFLTREPDVCELIASRLPAGDCTCTVSDNSLLFYDELIHKKMEVDLLVCDFKMFQHEVFNIFDFLKEKKMSIPLIFYNDPFPENEGRSLYWLAQNQEQFSRYDLDYLRPVLDRIAEIVEDPSIRPYVSLLQPPLPVTVDKMSDGNPDRIIVLPLIRRRNRMTPSLYNLFEFMYKNREDDISIDEIEKFLRRKKPGRGNRNSVYSYISRLRKCLEKDKLVKIDIIRTDTGCYRMILY
jgi:hypothetical protein